jgi:hypothetical protein
MNIARMCFFLQDYNLALRVLDTEPYSTLQEFLKLTPAKYGSIPRYFIQTDQDHVFLPVEFTYILTQNPPTQTYFMSGTDHSAFFSQPDDLVTLLKNIYAI